MIKKFSNFKYPKLTMLILVIILAYILFSNPSVQNFISNLGSLSYLGIFIAGIIGGLGALISDLLIFEFIKISFKDEFNLLKKTKIMKSTGFVIQRILGAKIFKLILVRPANIIILISSGKGDAIKRPGKE